MTEKSHGNRTHSKKKGWTAVDLYSFKKKGLTNDKISKMTGIPLHFINDQLEELGKVKNRSGVF